MTNTRKFTPFLKTIAILGGLVVLVAMWLLYVSVWYSPPIKARLTSPDGKPIAGAIVVANWNIEGYMNGASQGQAAVAEALTDQDGWFRIPSWGPRLVTNGGIRVDEPTVMIFKPGFIPKILKNYEDTPMQAANRIIRFRLQDKTIELQPFHGTLVEYEKAMAPLLDSLWVIYFERGTKFCYWRQTPRLLLALQDLKSKLAVYGAGDSLRLAYEYASAEPLPQCGDAKQFFLEQANARNR